MLAELAQKYGKTPAQVVLRWHVQLGNIVFPKSMHPERMRENIDVFDFELADDDVQAISALDATDGRLGPDPDTLRLITPRVAHGRPRESARSAREPPDRTRESVRTGPRMSTSAVDERRPPHRPGAVSSRQKAYRTRSHGACAAIRSVHRLHAARA